jgi:hypothetical protein
MSAFGIERTLVHSQFISGFAGKAEVAQAEPTSGFDPQRTLSEKAACAEHTGREAFRMI